jgi:methyl-accepting chemotaxis protein/methyl-accepting chemotaxis protein-1 (serine sensor receptor)
MNTKMTIGRKLMLSFAGLIVLVVTLSFTFLSVVGSLKDVFDIAVNKTATKISLAGTLDTAQSDMLAWQRSMVLFTFAKDPDQFSAALRRFQESSEIANRSVEAIRPLLVDDEGRRIADEARSGLAAWNAAVAEMERRCKAGDPAAALSYGMEHVVPIYDALSRNAARLKEIQAGRLEENRAEANTQDARSRWIALVMLVLSIGGGGIVFAIVRHITTVLQRVAVEMSDGAGQVAGAAAQVSASSQSLAQGSSEQAASIEETSAATEEIHSMARRNTENSNSAAALVSQSQQRFDETKVSLEQMVTAMNEITNSSDKISKIIKVIDEIAFQTNILALNAAVEAARAGEAGLGFAVVADEVRNLAQRCAQAAKDTAALIEDSVNKSNVGKVKVDQVAGAIRLVTEEAGKIKVLVDEISVGSQEQARGIEQIATAVTQMDKVTQKAAASAEEGASAAEELTAQSESLKNVVAQLVEMIGGAGARSAVASRAPRKPAPDHARGLATMASAVARRTPSAQPVAVHKAEKDAFPLETEF